MIEQAVRQGWQIPPNVFSDIPQKLHDVVCSPEASDRNKIAAARVLSMLHAQNKAFEPPAENHQPAQVTVYLPHNGTTKTGTIQEVLDVMDEHPEYLETAKARARERSVLKLNGDHRQV